jgi:hypothetical protein
VLGATEKTKIPCDTGDQKLINSCTINAETKPQNRYSDEHTRHTISLLGDSLKTLVLRDNISCNKNAETTYQNRDSNEFTRPTAYKTSLLGDSLKTHVLRDKISCTTAEKNYQCRDSIESTRNQNSRLGDCLETPVSRELLHLQKEVKDIAWWRKFLQQQLDMINSLSYQWSDITPLLKLLRKGHNWSYAEQDQTRCVRLKCFHSSNSLPCKVVEGTYYRIPEQKSKSKTFQMLQPRIYQDKIQELVVLLVLQIFLSHALYLLFSSKLKPIFTYGPWFFSL